MHFLSDVVAGRRHRRGSGLYGDLDCAVGQASADLQHRRIVPQQGPAHDLDRRVSLLQECIVEAL